MVTGGIWWFIMFFLSRVNVIYGITNDSYKWIHRCINHLQVLVMGNDNNYCSYGLIMLVGNHEENRSFPPPMFFPDSLPW